MSEEAPSTGRARRRTVKRIDYSKEQDFSDEDIFEDSEPEEAPKSKRGGRASRGSSAPRASRPSNTPLTLNDLDDDNDDDESVYDNKPVYTEKGYDSNLLPIRERFPFLPEYEEDGSPRIELIVGRRPVEEKEDAVQENEDGDENLPGSDDEEVETTPRKRTTRKRGREKKESPMKEKPANTGPVEYEYLVKFKGKSYLHLEWKTGADLESMNKSAKGIYRRYLKKVAQGTEEDIESPDFDPSFVTPEKVVDEAEQEIVVDLTNKELLRWEKEREKELAEGGDDDEEDDDDEDKGEEKKDEESPTDQVEEEKKGEVLNECPEHYLGDSPNDLPGLFDLMQKKRGIRRRIGPRTKLTSRICT